MSKRLNDKLTPQEVADIFHVDPKTVARWARSGKLDFTTTLGGHRRYSRSQIEALAASRSRETRN